MRKVNCYAIEYEVSLRGTEVRKETLLVPGEDPLEALQLWLNYRADELGMPAHTRHIKRCERVGEMIIDTTDTTAPGKEVSN